MAAEGTLTGLNGLHRYQRVKLELLEEKARWLKKLGYTSCNECENRNGIRRKDQNSGDGEHEITAVKTGALGHGVGKGKSSK